MKESFSQSDAGARWGLSGGIIASLCCLGPTVAALFGLTGATFLFSMLRYRPYFLAAGAVFMVAGVGLALRRSRQVCDVAQHRRNLWLFPSVALLSFGISYGVLTYVTPTLVYRSLRPVSSADQPVNAVAGTPPQGARGDAATISEPDGGGDANARSIRSQPVVTIPATEAAPAAAAPQEPAAPGSAPTALRRATLAIQGMT